MGGLYPDPKKINPLNQEKPKQPKKTKKTDGATIHPALRQLGESFPLPPEMMAILERDTIYQKTDPDSEIFDRDDLTFNPNRPGSLKNLLLHAPEAPIAALAAWDAKKTAEEIYGQDNISHGAGNAFLHAYLSYRLTEELGPKIARRFTDANEVRPAGNFYRALKRLAFGTLAFDLPEDEELQGILNATNADREKKSDLYHNYVGRHLHESVKDREEAIKILSEKFKKNHQVRLIDQERRKPKPWFDFILPKD